MIGRFKRDALGATASRLGPGAPGVTCGGAAGPVGADGTTAGGAAGRAILVPPLRLAPDPDPSRDFLAVERRGTGLSTVTGGRLGSDCWPAGDAPVPCCCGEGPD